MRWILLAPTLGLLAACDRARDDAYARLKFEESLAGVRALPSCGALPAPDPAWPRRGLGGFSMRFPPSHEVRTGGGIDSHVGSIVGSRGAVTFGLGWYESALVVDGNGRRVGTAPCRATIGGHPVRIVQEPHGDTAIFIGAAWIELPRKRDEPETGLTISGVGRDSAWVREAMASIASVRIDR